MGSRLRHVAKRSRRRKGQVSPGPRPRTQGGGGAAHGLVSADRDGAAVVRIHAQPGAARTGIGGRHGDALRVRVTAPPVGGRANVAIAAVLAEALGVPAAAVVLVSGAGHRQKRFRVVGRSPEEVARVLADVLAS